MGGWRRGDDAAGFMLCASWRRYIPSLSSYRNVYARWLPAGGTGVQRAGGRVEGLLNALRAATRCLGGRTLCAGGAAISAVFNCPAFLRAHLSA